MSQSSSSSSAVPRNSPLPTASNQAGAVLKLLDSKVQPREVSCLIYAFARNDGVEAVCDLILSGDTVGADHVFAHLSQTVNIYSCFVHAARNGYIACLDWAASRHGIMPTPEDYGARMFESCGTALTSGRAKREHWANIVDRTFQGAVAAGRCDVMVWIMNTYPDMPINYRRVPNVLLIAIKNKQTQAIRVLHAKTPISYRKGLGFLMHELLRADHVETVQCLCELLKLTKYQMRMFASSCRTSCKGKSFPNLDEWFNGKKA
jgi:hypothetical protein